jgi:hypothetical protein
VREGLSRRVAALPGPAQLALAVAAGLGGALAIFFAVVFPLVHNTGPLAAEVSGTVPDTAVVNQVLAVDLSIDNTGDRLINPVCVSTSFDRAVELQSVTFQGLDTVKASNGRACGGLLSTQETISIKVVLVPRTTGSVHAVIRASQQDTNLGPPLEGTIRVIAG